MRLFYIMMCFLFLSMPLTGQSIERTEKNLETYKLMIYGDSLSAGYKLSKEDSFYGQLQAALQEKGFEKVKVINQSKSGETTAGGIRRLSAALAEKPNAVILELGINDVLMGQSIPSIESNLGKIIKTFQEKGIPVLLIGMQAPPVAEPFYQRQFEKMYVDLAKKYNIMLYPFFMKDLFTIEQRQVKPVDGLLMGDHVHPTADGIRIIVQNILPDVIYFLNQNHVYSSEQKRH